MAESKLPVATSATAHVPANYSPRRVDPAKVTAITGGEEGEHHYLHLKRVNAFLDALRLGWTRATLDEGKQNPSAADVVKANEAETLPALLALAKDGKAFDMQSLPLTLPNSTENKLWAIAAEILKDPARFGVKNGFAGFKTFKPLGLDSKQAAPTK